MFDSKLIDILEQAQRIVVFTGAGASAESGIPTFRDALTGLWENFDPAQLATPEAYYANPDLVWAWYEWRRQLVRRCQPNAGHYAMAALQDHAEQVTVVTQNVDDLHERAGSRDVVHLHGSLHHPYCSDCARLHSFSGAESDGAPLAAEPQGGMPPPACVACGGMVRPGVVWFGESLPTAEWQRAHEEIAECDVLFSVGTSSVVYPAADLPRQAREAGATVIQVNPSETGLESWVHYNLAGPAGELLPALIDTAFGTGAGQSPA
ncbi:MAG TPA: NAD-dependent deacylase [Burkholderiaceae bacterium]|nr:NAD-dependent deacylase [Burkholderiaceae bacterium]